MNKNASSKPSGTPEPEDSGEWTELVQSRVSKRVKRLLKEHAKANFLSEAAFVRRVIYQHLGVHTPPVVPPTENKSA